MNQYSNSELLEGIRARNPSVLNHIYRNFLPVVEAFIVKHGGSKEDANDVFQEGLIIMYRYMVQNPPPVIANFGSYLFGTCRNVYLKFQEKRKSTVRLPGDYDREMIPPPDSPEFDASMKYSLFQKYFLSLDDDCRRVIKMYYEGNSMAEIATNMGYKDENYAKRKKYLCQKELIERIKQDPDFPRNP